VSKGSLPKGEPRNVGVSEPFVYRVTTVPLVTSR
jgi:hypothetical protein